MQVVKENIDILKELFKDVTKEYEIRIIDGNENLHIDETSVKEIPINENDYDFITKKFLGSRQLRINSINEIRQSKSNGSTLKINYDITGSGKTLCLNNKILTLKLLIV